MYSVSEVLMERRLGENSAGWRLGQMLVDFEQKHGNPTMDLLQ